STAWIINTSLAKAYLAAVPELLCVCVFVLLFLSLSLTHILTHTPPHTHTHASTGQGGPAPPRCTSSPLPGCRRQHYQAPPHTVPKLQQPPRQLSSDQDRGLGGRRSPHMEWSW